MAKSAAAKKPSKQLPLMDMQPVTESELTTDAERQEQYRLKQVARNLDLQRHECWAQHNTTTWINVRPCPCSVCVKLARKRT